MAVVVAPIVARYRSRFPGVAVELHEADPPALESMVANGDIDLAVRTADVAQRHHNVPSTPLFENPFGSSSAESIGDHGAPPTAPTRQFSRMRRLSSVAIPARVGRTIATALTGSASNRTKSLPPSSPPPSLPWSGRAWASASWEPLAAKITVTGHEVPALPLPQPLWLREIRTCQRADAEARPPSRGS